MLDVYEYEMSDGHSCCRFVGCGREREVAMRVLLDRRAELHRQGYGNMLSENKLHDEGIALLGNPKAFAPLILLRIETRR
jgi:hypothetical protein